MTSDFRPFGLSIYQNKIFVINEGYEKGWEQILNFEILADMSLNFLGAV